VGTVRILYRACPISLQAAVYFEHSLGALNMKERRTGKKPQVYAVLYSYNFWGSWEGKGKSKCIKESHFNIYACG